MQDNYLERILKAKVYDVAIQSPLEPAQRLSRRLSNHVWFKREDLQPVFSFKIRGAYNKIAQLSPITAQRGVICASAGNHAQGVALGARTRGIPAVVVMPVTTPEIKVQAVRDLGAEIVLHGDDYDQAYDHAVELARERALVFVHPFDDPDVIAGQGTVAMEILRQMHGDELDAIFVPVGGGGLIAGIAAYTKSLYPRIKIIGVEPEDAASMHASLAAGKRVTLERVGLFADGVAVRRVGEEPFRLAKAHVDEVLLVSTDQICAAIQDIFEDTRAIAEPAGALAVAGIKKYVAREHCTGRRLVAINCGANMNFDRLRHVAERADFGAQREALLAVELPETPGSFLRFCEIVGRRSVTEFNYRYDSAEAARIFVGLALTQGNAEREALVASIAAAGFNVHDMTDNEMAKLHVRYMVGGHARGIENERLFRFEFPERPGALLKFLRAVGTAWNISLFHYRNHGSDHGRVLAGIQVPPSTRDDFLLHLADLHYAYTDETDNPAYQIFLVSAPLAARPGRGTAPGAQAMSGIGGAPPVESRPSTAGAMSRGGGAPAGVSAGIGAGIGAGAPAASVDRDDIRPLDESAALQILIAEVQLAMAMPAAIAAEASPIDQTQTQTQTQTQALPPLLCAFLDSVPSDDASPAVFLEAVGRLQSSFDAALTRGVQIVGAWRSVAPAVVDAVSVTRAAALRVLSDEPPSSVIFDGPWARLQSRLDRFRRRRRRARRRLTDPDFDRGASDAQTARDAGDP